MRWLIASVLVVATAAYLAMRQNAGASGQAGVSIDPSMFIDWDWSQAPQSEEAADYYAEPDQTNNFIEDAIVSLNPANLIPANVPQDAAARNVSAFLTMIAAAEGTDKAGGYACLFGSTENNPRTFDSFADHPRIYTPFGTQGLKSSAAGRYQFLARTWDALARKLGLTDFGPVSQDLACIELIREKGALGDVQAGRIADAVRKCSKVWASLPGAGYGQPERQLQYLLAAYDYAGGTRQG